MYDLAALIMAELERWASDPGQGLTRPGAPGGGSYTDSTEFVGPVPVLDEMAKLRMVIGDDEVGWPIRMSGFRLFIFGARLHELLPDTLRSAKSVAAAACTRFWETSVSWQARQKMHLTTSSKPLPSFHPP